jgi:hypothetical protein
MTESTTPPWPTCPPLRLETHASHNNITTSAAPWPTYPPLGLETRAAVETACAAFHLSRRPQTLRGWACREDGPLRPIRVNGRLAWAVADIKRVLAGGKP